MTERTAFITCKVYGVVGDDNVLHTAIAEDASDEVYFSVVDENGETQFFEAEAYHVFGWCNDNNFTYFEGIMEADVDLAEVPYE